MVDLKIKKGMARTGVAGMFAVFASLPLAHAGGYDPMRPLAASSLRPAERVAVEMPQLQATLVSAQRRLAVIDGRTVSVGAQLAGYQVRSIEQGQVVLKGRNGNTQLLLQPVIVSPLATRLTMSGVD